MDDGLTPELRRMMVEYGEEFWGSGWGPLYGVLGGNPLAAMPSLHFATSVMAAHLLAETGPVAGALGWAYAGTLGVALVYLGEHYVVDLAAGLALAEGVRRARAGGDAAAGALLRRRAGARGAGARMSDGVRAHVESAPQDPQVNPEPREDDDDERPALQITPRNLIVLGGLPGRLARRALLPAAAARRPRRHLEPDRATGGPYWIARVAAVHARHVRRLRRDVPRRVRARRARASAGRASYQITMAGLAASRLFAAGGAGGLVLTAWALRRAGDAQAHGRRQDDLVPRPHLPALRAWRSSSAASACTGGCSPARTRSR